MKIITSVLILTMLSACGGTDDSSETANIDNPQPKITTNDYIPVICRDNDGDLINSTIKAGTIEDHSIVNDRGLTIKFTAFHPLNIDCPNTSNGAHPVILEGHGFGGSRGRDPNHFLQLRKQGYLVISISQEGFGDSDGQIRIMSPETDGQNLIAILDYIEETFDYTAWQNDTTQEYVTRPEIPESTAGGDNIIVGAIGASYGGGFQLLLNNIDPKQRLNAIAPDITWFDLRYSLSPNGVPTSIWDLLLFTIGQLRILNDIVPLLSNGDNPLQIIANIVNKVFPNLDLPTTYTFSGFTPRIEKMMRRGLLLNRIENNDMQYLAYRSPAYWCKTHDNIENIVPGVREIDQRHSMEMRKGTPALVSQGLRDDLFNFNEAWWNWQCLKKRADPEQDVFLYTHQGGHIIEIQQLGTVIDLINTNEAPPGNCGSIDYMELRQAFFDQQLNKKDFPEKFKIMKTHACFSLDHQQAVFIPFESIMAPRISELPGDQYSNSYTQVSANSKRIFLSGLNFLDILDPSGKINNNFLTNIIADILSHRPILLPPNLLITKNMVPRNIKLLTVEKDGVIAGIPEITMTMTPSGIFHLCDTCNVIVNIGLGIKRANRLIDVVQRIDRQTIPIRGTDTQYTFDLAGIAERIYEGDELYLMVYPQLPRMWNPFDIQAPAVKKIDFESTVKLPIYDLDNPVIVTDFDMM